MSLIQNSTGFMRLPYTIFILALGHVINISFVCVSQTNNGYHLNFFICICIYSSDIYILP